MLVKATPGSGDATFQLDFVEVLEAYLAPQVLNCLLNTEDFNVVVAELIA